jgi:hypothetical protein
MNFMGITNKKKAIRAYRAICHKLRIRIRPEIERLSAHKIIVVIKDLINFEGEKKKEDVRKNDELSSKKEDI